MSQCKIYLENYSGVYYAGSEIRGRLECYFDDEVSVRGIKIRVKCKEENSWSGTETYTDPADNRSKTRTITLTGDHDVFFHEQMLFGSSSGTRELSRGRHVYPFTCHLPHDIPSTYNGPYGSITYKIKGIVDRPMRTDYDDDFIFVVQSPIDFNHESQDLQNISTYSDEKSVCCWCCAGGNITMDVELPKIAFVPGETIPFKVKMTNLSNSNVESLKVKFTKTVTYKVTEPDDESKTDTDSIVAFNEHGVGAHGEYTYNLQLAIPGYLEVPNFTKCDLFKVSYELIVSAEMPSCTLDLDVNVWDIKMGHIQCVPHAQGDQGSKQPYPTESPYPNAATYPMPPGNGAQYPPMGIPPPGPGFTPYPASNNMVYPPTSPSAPSPSAPSAPIDDVWKAREAASGPSGPSNTVPELPPPSYDEVQHGSNLK